ncbi:SAM-dependent methyltransferase [Parvibium lacunae]|uniref:SAM-dependent methyltransferase n=1 Tax=Parvibium lacunae TaxID=1888893 RepID=A0A368L3V3_9BURK|nr:SAM-dependent methyltransferase [Parvibium lacunae]RCS58244.1 SAM-dependent methyltransferase [Parvibium lacunae]
MTNALSSFGKLFLIPSWLGNTTVDQTLPNATQALVAACQYFIVENAKPARAFLKTLPLSQPLQSLHIQELPRSLAADIHGQPLDYRQHRALLRELLAPAQAGHNMGLLADAGCPGIADPGALVVACAHELGISVQPLIGPSSILLALMAAGLNGQQFAFNGYVPQQEPDRQRQIQRLEQRAKQENQTQVFIETPYRNVALFDGFIKYCQGDSRLTVATDLSLASEYIQTHTIDTWRKKGAPDIHRRPTVFCLLA